MRAFLFSTTTICLGPLFLLLCPVATSFLLLPGQTNNKKFNNAVFKTSNRRRKMDGAVVAFAEPWQGDVVANEGGVIRGCSIQQVGDSVTDWIITIDGNDADLGRFSEAIYKKITADAKQQRFQGFRPGTIPPHLEPTYRAFAMDECARETVLEAMQQNDIRPFTDARSDFLIENVSIPPPPPKRGKKKKKGGGKKNKNTVSTEDVVEEKEEVPSWQTYETMKEAIDAGWKPGQSFSFVAKHVKGQKVLGKGDVAGAQPIVKPGLF